MIDPEILPDFVGHFLVSISPESVRKYVCATGFQTITLLHRGFVEVGHAN
jgi:hypothetical protein